MNEVKKERFDTQLDAQKKLSGPWLRLETVKGVINLLYPADEYYPSFCSQSETQALLPVEGFAIELQLGKPLSKVSDKGERFWKKTFQNRNTAVRIWSYVAVSVLFIHPQEDFSISTAAVLQSEMSADAGR